MHMDYMDCAIWSTTIACGLCHMDNVFHHHSIWTVPYGPSIPPPFHVDCAIWTRHSTTIPYRLYHMDHPFHYHFIWTVPYGPGIPPPFHIIGLFCMDHLYRP